jgi:phospholipid/cholesterol/gamma-HCH transport system ATP-binding protein
MIKIDNVHKSLDGKEVLRGINLEVKKGEVLAIIGGSGMGKSVMLKHILGFLRPDSGDVLVDGVSIPNCSIAELYEIRKTFGVVFQSPALLQSLTVEENVSLPLNEHSDFPGEKIAEIVRDRLHLVRLFDVEGKLPAQLSGGMQKRVSLARALVMDPAVMLFDEPATGLDPVLTATIGQLIVDLHRRIGFTSIAVTHNMDFAYMIADRIAMLHQGKIIAEGTPEEIRNTAQPQVRNFIMGIPLQEDREGPGSPPAAGGDAG